MTTDTLGMDAPSIEDLRRNSAVAEGDEYEFVLGRRQVASLSFVVLVLVALFSGISYLAGRAAVPNKKEASVKVVTPVASTETVLAAGLIAAPAQKPIVGQAAVNPSAANATTPSSASGNTAIANTAVANPAFANSAAVKTALFAEPVAGAIYIQTGAVERGVAAIMAEGLRAHGFNAFVASGPTEKVFRVLMGPFPSIDAYESAKATLDEIGLSAFSRQYHK